MVTTPVKLTPTQRKIMDLLNDGEPHVRADLLACLWDELGSLGTVRVHVHHLRKLLKPLDRDIVTRMIGRTLYYQQVRIYRPDADNE